MLEWRDGKEEYQQNGTKGKEEEKIKAWLIKMMS